MEGLCEPHVSSETRDTSPWQEQSKVDAFFRGVFKALWAGETESDTSPDPLRQKYLAETQNFAKAKVVS